MTQPLRIFLIFVMLSGFFTTSSNYTFASESTTPLKSEEPPPSSVFKKHVRFQDTSSPLEKDKIKKQGKGSSLEILSEQESRLFFANLYFNSSNYKTLECLKITNISLGPTHANIIRNTLTSFPHLKDLALCSTKLSAEDLADIFLPLSSPPPLETLDLSGHDFNGTHITSLSNILFKQIEEEPETLRARFPQLKSLILRDTQMGWVELDTLWRSFIAYSSLHYLHLTGNNCHLELKCNQNTRININHVTLQSNNEPEKVVHFLSENIASARGLPISSSIISLNLSNSALSANDLVPISEALRHMPNLEKLNLSGNNLNNIRPKINLLEYNSAITKFKDNISTYNKILKEINLCHSASSNAFLQLFFGYKHPIELKFEPIPDPPSFNLQS